ncbi:SET domain-containing protein, partial [Paraburkholderia caledonica]|uniref:SET domain-containing protein n=1 Tax=Paraburkholderia caledonica TaxID=134536 RepID=UPI000B3F797E
MGLFALQPIAAGERVIEYKGELTSWRHAAVRQRSKAGRTFVFGLSDGRMVDGSRGNSARFLNHACVPNCEAIETGDWVFIHALAPIAAGDELYIDYGLSVDGEITDNIRVRYTCHCGTSASRRTVLGNNAESAKACCRAENPMSDASGVSTAT